MSTSIDGIPSVENRGSTGSANASGMTPLADPAGLAVTSGPAVGASAVGAPATGAGGSRNTLVVSDLPCGKSTHS